MSLRAWRRSPGSAAVVVTPHPPTLGNTLPELVGLFFRSTDPAALGQWYKEHLGIDLVPNGYSQPSWSQEAGPTVFVPFARDTDYFGRADRQWMVNFRVRDLDAIVGQLRAAKIEVVVDPEAYPNGRFARLHDPEGNPIELWETK